MVQREFILYSDHEAPKYINGQHKINSRHAKWIAYLQEFTFSLKHKSGTQNKVADALSRRMNLLTTLGVWVVGFDVFLDRFTACSKGNGEIIICMMVFCLEVCSYVFMFVFYGSVS